MAEGGTPAVGAAPVVKAVVNPAEAAPVAQGQFKAAAVNRHQEQLTRWGALDAENTPNNKNSTEAMEAKQHLDAVEAAKRLRPFWKRGDGRDGIYNLIKTQPQRVESRPKNSTPDIYTLSGDEKNKSRFHTPLRDNLHPNVLRRPASNPNRQSPRLAGGRPDSNIPSQYQLQEAVPKGKSAIRKIAEAVNPFRTDQGDTNRFNLEGSAIQTPRRRSSEQKQNSRQEATSTRNQAENSRPENNRQRPQNTVESRYLQNRMTEWNRTNPEPRDAVLHAAWENRRKTALEGFKDMALTHALEVQYEKTIEPHPTRRAKANDKLMASQEDTNQWIARRNEWIYGKRDTATGERTGGEKNRIENQRADYKKQEEARKKAEAAAKAAAANPTTPVNAQQPASGGQPAAATGPEAKSAGQATGQKSAAETTPAASGAKAPEAAKTTSSEGTKTGEGEPKKDSNETTEKEGAKSAETEASKERNTRVQKYMDDVEDQWNAREPANKESAEYDLWERGKNYALDQAEIDANALIDLRDLQAKAKDGDEFKEPPKTDRVAHRKWGWKSEQKRQELAKKYEGLRDLKPENNPHVTVGMFKEKKASS